jgi:flagellar hook-associated protein 2
LHYGTASDSGILIHSATNEFQNVVDGVNLTINKGTREAVTVSVKQTNAALTTAIGEFVDAYNSIRTALDEMTAFDAEALTTGILFGTREALRVESDLTHLISGRFFGVGNVTSLDSIGISLDAKGKMEFDKEKLQSALAIDAASIEKLFTHETLGVSAKLEGVVNELAGEEKPGVINHSLLASRTRALTTIIETNNERVTKMDERLARQRDILLTEFSRLESLVANMQRNLTALSSLQVIPPLTSTSRS